MTEKNELLKSEKEQEQEFYQAVNTELRNTETRLAQKRKEFENVKQCGARLTKHRFSF